MVFSSHIFLFYFLPFVLLFYYLLPFTYKGLYLRNAFLTIASYAFYGWFEPWFILLMITSTVIDFTAGKMISRKNASKMQKNFALVMSCIANLAMLGFFKYYMFIMGGINHLIEFWGGNANTFHILNVVLPVGISFYTFQTMSYTIDVWRGDAQPVKKFSSFSCFVALFPQLIAGPIVRYNTIAQQLDKREHDLDKFASGTAIFVIGLAKKILLANPAGIIADAVFDSQSPTMLTSWWGILAYHFQIYFDFCGYSDMAVGLGRMFGFEFPKNFDSPYRSVSITDFWRRWHISLSSWIRDYLYIPLGGNRKGKARTYFNLIFVFFLCGLWHGANITFVLWGMFHGLFLVAERLTGKKSLYGKLPRIVCILITNVIVMFGWVLFRSESLPSAVLYWKSMTGFAAPLGSSLILESSLFNFHHVVQILLCVLFTWQPIQAFEYVKKLTPVKYTVLFATFILAVAAMFSQSFNPFLYFQF